MSTNYTEQTWADGDATKPLSAARLTHIEDGIAAVDTAAQSAASTEATRATTAEGLLAPKASPALTGSPTAPTQAANDNSTKLATTAYADAAAGARLTKGNVVTKTSAYTAVVGDVILADTTTATFTVTIPAASGGKGRIVVKWVKGTTAPTINLTGTDHVNTSAGVQTFTPVLLNQGYQLESDGAALWAVTADDLPLSALDTRYAAAGATGGGAGLPSTIVTKTGAYTAAAGDFVEADTSTAGFTVTLPTAPAAGTLVAVKKVSSDANTLTIAAAGGGTIDGNATTTTATQWAGVVLEHKASNVWRVAASMSTTGPQGVQGVQGNQGVPGPGATSYTLPIAKYMLLNLDTNNLSNLTLNQEYCYPVLLPGTGTIDTIAARVNNTPDASTVLRFAVRTDNAGVPGAVVSEGSVPVTASGWKTWVLGTPYAYNGQFWISVVGQGWSTGSPQMSMSSAPSPLIPDVLASARTAMDWGAGLTSNCTIQAGVTGTLAAAGTPTSPQNGSGTGGFRHLFAIRRAS